MNTKVSFQEEKKLTDNMNRLQNEGNTGDLFKRYFPLLRKICDPCFVHEMNRKGMMVEQPS